jgi:phosphohistidine swiveling domain-containing protein
VAGLLATSGEQGPPDFELPPAPGPSADSKQQIVRDLAYLRSHRAEAINRAIWTAAPLFDSVSERLGVSPGEVPFFLPGELIDALGGSAVDRGQPERRRAAFATVLFEDAFSSATGDGEIEEIRRRLGLPGAVEASDGAPDADPAEPLLRGVVASPGRATGHVRLVRDDGDDHKVEKGDILVTTMTFPSLVGSMQRSAAIVTDDGGLLSHAAVTARELQKPCLIDTARATEVLSDRDLVEVDCEAGVVNHAGIGAGRRFGGNKS